MKRVRLLRALSSSLLGLIALQHALQSLGYLQVFGWSRATEVALARAGLVTVQVGVPPCERITFPVADVFMRFTAHFFVFILGMVFLLVFLVLRRSGSRCRPEPVWKRRVSAALFILVPLRLHALVVFVLRHFFAAFLLDRSHVGFSLVSSVRKCQ